MIRYIVRFQFINDSGKEYIYSENRDYEGEYWLRHFEAAIMFIESLDLKTLKEKKPSKIKEMKTKEVFHQSNFFNFNSQLLVLIEEV